MRIAKTMWLFWSMNRIGPESAVVSHMSFVKSIISRHCENSFSV